MFFFFFFFFFKQKTAYEIGLGFLLNRSSDLARCPEIRAHDNRPLLVMRSNLWASGYDVDGTDQTSLGQFSGRVQQTYKHSVPRFRSEERRVGEVCKCRREMFAGWSCCIRGIEFQ